MPPRTHEEIGSAGQRNLGPERHDQTTKPDIARCYQLVSENDTRPFARGIERMVGHVEAQPARRVDAFHAYHAQPILPSRHDTRQIDLNEIEAGEVLMSPQRLGALQEPRAAKGQKPLVGQLLNVEVRVTPRTQPYADVHAVGDEVRVARAGRDARLDIGMPGKKSIEPGHDPLCGETRRCAHHQDAVLPGAVELLQGHAQAFEPGPNAGLNETPGLGQLDGPRAAMKQLEAEKIFQPANLMTERCRRHMQLICGLREAQVAGRGLEGLEGVQRWQRTAHT